MFVKFLGILDIVSAVIVLIYYYGLVSVNPVIGAILYLAIKCAVFFGDVLSVVDGIMAFMMILLLLTGSGFIAYILIAYLLLKGVVSLF